MEKIRVALVHNIVTPYRSVLFDTLADHPEIDLHVFYCAKSHNNRNWALPNSLSHRHTFLPGIALDRADFHYHINPTVITELILGEFDAAIIAGGTNFTMQLGYVTSKVGLDATVFWTERIRPPKNALGKIIDPITQAIARHADSVIVPTNRARQYQNSRGIPSNQIFTAPNIVDNSDYYRHQNQEGPFRVLFVGQLIERKGISYLLEGYNSINRDDTELVIVGDGDNRDTYEQWAADHNLDVTFTGWVSEERKQQELAEADLFVLPSVEDLAPLVLNEALASGLPVLTTYGVGNAADMIIEGGNGYIVPACDANALADKLSMLLSTHTELNRMGDRSQRIIDEQFSPSFTANQFVAAIKSGLTA